jgi:hypothetical protein
MAIFIENIDAKIDPDSIVGIWLLDEGQGDTVKDSSGNGNDGNIINAKWTDGKFGKALEFNGSARVEIPPSKSIDDFLDGFTYLLWVQPTAQPPNVNTRVIERDWHNPTIQIGSTDADFYGSIAVNADQAQTNVRGGEWKQGKWSFVAITHDGSDLKLYVDGESVGEKTVGKPDAKLNGQLRLASWKDPGWVFTGILDDVGVFNTPLSDNDIKQIMDKGLEEALAVSPVRKLATTWARVKRIR